MKTALSIWLGERRVPESLPEIAARISARYRVGIRDLRGSRGSKRVCEARRAVMAEAASDGHQHKVIAYYLGRTRSAVSHAVEQWDGMATG